MSIFDIVQGVLDKGKEVVTKTAAFEAAKPKPSAGVSAAFSTSASKPQPKSKLASLGSLFTPDFDKGAEERKKRTIFKGEVISKGLGLAAKPLDYLSDIGTGENVYKRNLPQNAASVVANWLKFGETAFHTPDKQERIDKVNLVIDEKSPILKNDYKEIVDNWNHDKKDLNAQNLENEYARSKWVTIPAYESDVIGFKSMPEQRVRVTPEMTEQIKNLAENGKLFEGYEKFKAGAILGKKETIRGETAEEKENRLLAELYQDEQITDFKQSMPGKIVDGVIRAGEIAEWVRGADWVHGGAWDRGNLLREDWGLKKKDVLSRQRDIMEYVDRVKLDPIGGVGAHIEMFTWNIAKMAASTGMQYIDYDQYIYKQNLTRRSPDMTKEEIDKAYEETEKPESMKAWAQMFDTMSDLIGEKQQALAKSAEQDPDTLEGQFFNKILFPGVDGLTSLVSMLGTAWLTKNPALAAGFWGYVENSDTYIEGKRAGLDPLVAWSATMLQTGTTAILEKVSMDFFFTMPAGWGWAKKMALNTPMEGVTEMGQEWGQNLIKKVAYDENQDVFEGTWEAFIGAVIAGGGAASMQSITGMQTPPELIKARDTFVGQMVNLGASKAEAQQMADIAFKLGLAQREMFDNDNPFKESKQAFKTGMAEGMGETGMTYLKSIKKTPSVTDLGVTVSAEPEKGTAILEEPGKLVEEAKKYKSAEEFVKAQGEPVYHGTQANFDKFDFELTGKSTGETPVHNLKGTWFVDNKNIAKGYGDTIKENVIDTSNFNKIDAKGKTLNDFRDEIWEAKKLVSEEGKSGLIVKNLVDNKDWSKVDVGNHIFVVDKNAIKTKSQLADIWNQAHVKPEEKVVKETPEEVNVRHQERIERAIAADETMQADLKGFNEGNLELFREIKKQVSKNQKFQEGDLETVRDSELRDTVNQAVESMKEKYNDISDDEAYNRILDIPTKKEAISTRAEIEKARQASIEPMIKTRESTILKNKLKKFEQGIRRGEIKSRISIKKVQRFLTTSIKGKLAEDMFIDAKDKAKVKGEFLETIRNIQTPKQLLAKIKDIESRLNKSIETKGKKYLQTRIKHELEKLTSKKNEKGKTTTEYEMLRNGMKEIFYEGNKLRTQEQNVVLLSELEAKLEDNTMETGDYITYALLSESEGVKGLNDMSNAELDAVLTRVQQTRKIARDSFLWKQVERAVEMERKMEGTIENMRGEEVDGVIPSNKKTTFQAFKKWVSTVDIFDRGYAQIVSLLDTIKGGRFFRDVLIQPISEANDNFAIREDVRKQSDKKFLQEIFGRKGTLLDRKIKSLNKQKYLGEFTDAQGKKVNLHFRNYELIDLYINSKMEDNLNAMRESGIYVGGKSASSRVVYVTDEMIQAFEDKMSPEAKKIAEYIMEQIGDKGFMKEVIKAYEEKYNKPFPLVEGGYWAMTRRYMGQKQKGGDMFHPEHVGRGVPTPKSFKERVANDNPLLPTDGWSKYLNWWTDNARFVAYDKVLVDIRSIITNKNFKSEFQEVYGSAGYGQMLDSFDWTASGGLATANKVMLENSIQSIQRALSVVAIGAKTRNILSQGLSAPAAMADMSIKNFAKGLAKTIARPDIAYKKMMEIPSIKFRHTKAGFTKGMFLQEAANMQKQGKSIAELAMTFTKWGDMIGVTGAGYAVYDFKFNQFQKEGMTKEQADKYAKQEASDFVSATQQSSLPEYANAIQRSNPAVRTLGVFQQAQSMYRAKGYEAMSEWSNSKDKWSRQKFAPLVRRLTTYHLIMPALYEMSRGNFNPLSIAVKSAFSPVSGFMGWGKVVEWGIMYAVIKGLAAATDWDDELYNLMPFDPSTLVGEAMDIFTKAVNSTNDLIEGDGDNKDIFNLTVGIGAIFSIPVKNIKEEYAKFKDVATGEVGLFRLLQTEWQAGQEKKKQAKRDDLFSSLGSGKDLFASLGSGKDLFAGLDSGKDLFANITF